jgi:hypothetical protein
MTGPLSRALDAEIRKRRNRMEKITPRLKALKDEYMELKDSLAELEEMRGKFGDAGTPTPPRTTTAALPGEPSETVAAQMEDVKFALSEHGALSPADLADRLQWMPAKLKEPLRRLRETGAVVAEGSTVDRRYSLAER